MGRGKLQFSIIVFFVICMVLHANTVLVSGIQKETSFNGLWKLSIGPSFDDNSEIEIQFPNLNYTFQEHTSRTYWFQREFSFSSHLNLDAVGIYLGRLPDACEVFVNDSLILQTGRNSRGQYFPNLFETHSLILPSHLLKTDSSNTIRLKVYSERSGAILPEIYISTPQNVLKERKRLNMLNAGLGILATAVSLITALYFFVLFLMKRDDAKYLYMTVSSIGFSLNSTILYLTVNVISYEILLKSQFIGLYWGAVCMLLFVARLLKFPLNEVVRNLFLGGTLLFSIIQTFMPDIQKALYFNDRIVYLLWIVPQILLLLIIAIYGIWRKIRISWVILLGVIIAINGALRDIVLLQLDSPPDFYSNLMGLIFLIVSIFIAFAIQYVDAEKKLRVLTYNLEDRVQKRTKELELANQKLSEQVITDMLTGAYNRLEFARVMESEEARFRRSRGNYAAIYMDLDNFKYVNDTFGHPAGDLVLFEAARVLQKCTRSTDYLFRMGGDEFLILMTDISSGKDALVLAERIYTELFQRDFFKPELQQSLGREIAFPKEKKLSLSMGISTTDTLILQSLQDLPIHADLALLDAKGEGKNRYAVYKRDD